ncbi:glutamine synthetase family protein [Streptacidiphilus sp. ASG 303]|uniref:glutamine synthetase family protein n=1 Tax=Streptacidiphilus sp. ASG 303 TaxID=2896847 RepID=UPI001E303913|nr:glutamine synthetase family protein [Streptacidiphilus sp. ASG 303]MCD0481308.1 glutamine synthetase family protein [Streptacidiphilus sp. ASG 303]
MPPLTLDALRAHVESGEVHTVVLAFTDMQGRLQGKRFAARFFLDEVARHGSEGCAYLLAVDVDLNTVDGYRMASWDTGYGDFAMLPDLSTLRRVPWQPGTALATADLAWHDGTPVAASPRQILRRQLDRLAERGWRAYTGTELEFLVFRDTYEDAWRRGYRDLTPANQYNVDYSLLGTARIEPLLARIRNEMGGAGMTVESAKGECNLGQHEVAFRYDEALTTCDQHSVYKTGAKEIAAQEGCALTFMAKYDEREGNSCHVHLSLRDEDGAPVFADPDGAMGDTMRHFLAGQLAALRELTLLYAPNINSYKRFRPGSFAPTAVAWGRDNRTCALRVVGHGPSLRLENRLPGGDVNPYLAVAGMVAAGLHGVERKLELPEPCTGNAYTAGHERVPATLREAAGLWEGSALAREAFGEEVVAHYLTAARVEQDAHDTAVTDWERYRSFERM